MPKQSKSHEPKSVSAPERKSRAEARKEFAKNLVTEMETRGFSQSDLARFVFPEKQTPGAGAAGRDKISTYVNGLNLPRPKHLKTNTSSIATDPASDWL